MTSTLGNVVARLIVWSDIYEDNPAWYRAPIWWVTVPVLVVWLRLHRRYWKPEATE